MKYTFITTLFIFVLGLVCFETKSSEGLTQEEQQRIEKKQRITEKQKEIDELEKQLQQKRLKKEQEKLQKKQKEERQKQIEEQIKEIERLQQLLAEKKRVKKVRDEEKRKLDEELKLKQEEERRIKEERELLEKQKENEKSRLEKERLRKQLELEKRKSEKERLRYKEREKEKEITPEKQIEELAKKYNKPLEVENIFTIERTRADGKIIDYDELGNIILYDVKPTKLGFYPEKGAPRLFEVHQNPSLIQIIPKKDGPIGNLNDQDQTNLCGYYAIFNAQSIVNNKDQMDRNAFGKELTEMLKLVAKMRQNTSPYKAMPYDDIKKFENLEDLEIIEILENLHLKNKILVISDNTMDEGFMELLGQTNYYKTLKNLIKNFSDKNDLIIIYLAGKSHYLTIHAQLIKPKIAPEYINFTIYDSIGHDYTQQHLITTRVKPLYDFLTGK